MSAVKTANVNARIEADIKQKAESILMQIGLPRSVAIDLYYRQIIMHHGIPFIIELPEETVHMSKSEYNSMMAKGLEQAKSDDSFNVNEVFDEIDKKLGV